MKEGKTIRKCLKYLKFHNYSRIHQNLLNRQLINERKKTSWSIFLNVALLFALLRSSSKATPSSLYIETQFTVLMIRSFHVSRVVIILRR